MSGMDKRDYPEPGAESIARPASAGSAGATCAGGSAAQGSHAYDLDNCIKCTICLAHCPVSRVTDRFAGPKQNGPDLERFRLMEPAAIHPSIVYCTGCRTCEVVCPSGVPVAAMNSRAKAQYVARYGAPLRDRLLATPDVAGRLATLAPGLINRLGRSSWLRAAGEKLAGVSAALPLPGYAPQTFGQLYRRWCRTRSGASVLAGSGPAAGQDKVLYYPGCFVNYNQPQIGLAVLEVLAAGGVEVQVEEFPCCGLPAISAGLYDTARSRGEANLRRLKPYLEQGYRVVTTCPSCLFTLSQKYGELLGLDLAGRPEQITDVFSYLLELKEQGRFSLNPNPLPLKLAYHQPCHQRALGCGSPSLDVLALIPELEVVDLAAGCCGLAGTYGFKKEKYPISRAIGENVRQAMEQLALSEAVTECGMCALQIGHLTGARVCHPVELLARALKPNI
ncbi:MAG: anaerobic glycerol-3-phosphate dehydrogenase subunit C [Desulfurispora sp.]|uniref:anaerobic glycerol-3-phosphate dehydrogenase subunit C n=1 Tax=Desulfurispora sp. TaxID=3014275 RepID=UPI0040496F15